MNFFNKVIEKEDAEGEIKEIYTEIEKKYGFIPDTIKIQSINPFYLKQYIKQANYFETNTSMSAKFRMITNFLISHLDKTTFCIDLLETFLLNKFNLTQEEINRIVKIPESAPLEKKEKALLLFLLKVLKNSNSITKEDFDILSRYGYLEEDVFDALNFATQMRKYHIIFNTINM